LSGLSRNVLALHGDRDRVAGFKGVSRGGVTAERLLAACSDGSEDSGSALLRSWNRWLVPGRQSSCRSTLAGDRQRWWTSDNGPAPVDVVMIDNVPSQANRLEAALEWRTDLGLPRVLLDLAGAEPFPAHLPRALTGFRFPHRQADAYLRMPCWTGRSSPRAQ